MGSMWFTLEEKSYAKGVDQSNDKKPNEALKSRAVAGSVQL
jgi:hypothetical protein